LPDLASQLDQTSTLTLPVQCRYFLLLVEQQFQLVAEHRKQVEQVKLVE
jgi:hypothetical protein